MFHSFFFLIWSFFSVHLGGGSLNSQDGTGIGHPNLDGTGIGHPCFDGTGIGHPCKYIPSK